MSSQTRKIEPIGGTPVREEFLPFSPPSIGVEEEEEIIDTLRSGWITTGPKSRKFEEALAQYCDVNHVVGTSSCTGALHIAMALLDLEPGDEVITTPFTFASTSHAILYQGATPVFADIRPDTFNINPEEIEALITPRTKAIVPVDYGGHPCDMDPILRIARHHGLKVVVDAAHSVGAEYKGRKVGTMGDVVCLSFYATKNLATGEGGAFLTNDGDVAEKARILTMYGISDAREIWQRYTPKGSWFYDVRYLGFKYNFTDIQAALGLHQLAKVDGFNERRRENGDVYRQELEEFPFVRLPIEREHARTNYHLFPILLDLDSLQIDRAEFTAHMQAENVGVSVLYLPLPQHTVYRERLGVKTEDYPVTDDVFRRIVNLPISPAASTEDIRDASKAVRKICEHFAA